MTHFLQLDNGIRLIVKQMQGLLSVTMGIIVGTGACVETDKEDGVSHFIEHMMFKGTKKRNAFQISDELESLGAQVNAFTSKDITCYYVKSITSTAPKAFEILADLFLESTFPEDEMVKEKGVIVEEINMYDDNPDELCLYLLEQAYYGERGYGRTILGTIDNVNSFTKADVDDYMQARYTTDNIVISMAGNITKEQAIELANKYFTHLPATKKAERKIEHAFNYSSLVKKKDIEQIHIGMAFDSVARYDELQNASQILNIILGGGMSSRLYQRVREELGLAYTVYSYLAPADGCGNLTVYAGVNAKNYLKSYDAIIDCIKTLKNSAIKQEEFERCKQQMLASLIYSQENTGSQMLLYGKELIYKNEIYDFESKTSAIENLKIDKVNEALQINLDLERCAKVLVGNVDKPLN